MKNAKLIKFFIGICVFKIVFYTILLQKPKVIHDLAKIRFIKSIVQKEVIFKCGRFPKDEIVVTDNIFWQILETSNNFINIFNAYLDLRQNKSVVRIIANSRQINNTDNFHCQFWVDEYTEPQIVKVSEVLLMWGEKKTSF